MNENLKEKIYRITCLVSDIDSTYHQLSVRLGLSDSMSFIFYMLYINNGSCELNEIYKISGISKQTINSAVRKLEEDEIIYLEKVDGRHKKVCTTQKGREYIEQTAGRMYRAEMETFDNWKPEEIEQFISTLEKYNTLFKQQVERI